MITIFLSCTNIASVAIRATRRAVVWLLILVSGWYFKDAIEAIWVIILVAMLLGCAACIVVCACFFYCAMLLLDALFVLC